MDCKKVEKALIECDLDNLPDDVLFHCLNCEECGRKFHLLKGDFAMLEQMKEEACEVDVTSAVMARINETGHWYRGRVAKITISTLAAASIALALIFNVNKTPEITVDKLVAINNKGEDVMIDEMLTEVYLTSELDTVDEEAVFEAYYGMER